MGKRVLVALDDSVRASGVLGVAADYARRLDAELYIVRSITVPRDLMASLSTDGDDDPLVPRLRESAREELRALLRRQPSATIKETIVEMGYPAQTITAVAERISADLIVVGSHGYRGWDRVLGTTASSVANLAICNVLIVHDQASSESPAR